MMDKQREFLSMGLLLVDGSGCGGAGGGGGNGKTFINGEIVKVDKQIYTYMIRYRYLYLYLIERV